MTLALDFGSASIKAILVDSARKAGRIFTFNLGFRSPVLNRSSLTASLKILETLSGERLLGADGKTFAKIYACSGLPVFETTELLAGPAILTSQAISCLESDILDVGFQLVHFRERVSLVSIDSGKVADWLPFKTDAADISGYLGNKKIYSSILPVSPRDLFIEQALSRVRIIEFFRSQRIDPSVSGEIYLTGAVFSRAPYLEQALLILLDSLQPRQMIRVWLDRRQILPALGLLKYYSVDDFSGLSDDFNPIFLGTVLPLNDSCEVKIDLRLNEPQKVDLKKGDLYVFPLQLGEEAGVEVAYRSARGKKQTYEVSGGAVGLIFDLRDRPLVLPDSSAIRFDLLKKWDQQISASGQVEKII